MLVTIIRHLPRVARARHDMLRIRRTHYHVRCRDTTEIFGATIRETKSVPGKRVLCMIIAPFPIASECFDRVLQVLLM